MGSNRGLLIIGGALAVLFVGLVIFSPRIRTNTPLQSSIFSPYSNLTVTGAPNGTGGGVPANITAEGQYTVLGLDQLALPGSVGATLQQNLQTALNAVAIPTTVPSFIQIDTSTLQCGDQYDCSFSFYVDSPESYYAYRQFFKPDGSVGFSIKRLPMEGPVYE